MADETPKGYRDSPRDSAKNADIGDFDQIYQRALMQGYPEKLFEFYEGQIAGEPVLESAHDLRQAGVSSAEVSILAADDSTEAEQARGRIATMLQGVDLKMLLELAADEVPTFGVHASEINWVRDGGEIRPESLWHIDPVALAWVPPNGFSFGAALPPGTWLIRTGPWKYETLSRDRWLLIPRKHRGSPANYALSRASVIFSLFVKMAIKNWVAFVDRYGLPIIEVAMAAKGDTKLEELADAIIRDIASIGGFKTTEDDAITVTIHDAAAGSRVGSSDVQERLLKWLESSIGRLWNGGALVQGTGTGSSSYSLGMVHENAQATLYGAAARRIAGGISRCIVEPYMRINSIEGPAPRIEILTRAERATRIGVVGYLAQNRIVPASMAELSRLIGMPMRLLDEGEVQDG